MVLSINLYRHIFHFRMTELVNLSQCLETCVVSDETLICAE